MISKKACALLIVAMVIGGVGAVGAINLTANPHLLSSPVNPPSDEAQNSNITWASTAIERVMANPSAWVNQTVTAEGYIYNYDFPIPVGLPFNYELSSYPLDSVGWCVATNGDKVTCFGSDAIGVYWGGNFSYDRRYDQSVYVLVTGNVTMGGRWLALLANGTEAPAGPLIYYIDAQNVTVIQSPPSNGSIEEIAANPSAWVNKTVTVEGYMCHWLYPSFPPGAPWGLPSFGYELSSYPHLSDGSFGTSLDDNGTCCGPNAVGVSWGGNFSSRPFYDPYVLVTGVVTTGTWDTWFGNGTEVPFGPLIYYIDAQNVTVIPSPSIDQPSAITCFAGATVENITWNPLSQRPAWYYITLYGTVIATPRILVQAEWDGGSITVNATGLAPGAYQCVCTVGDKEGRSATSSVNVTVLPAN